VKDLAKDLVKAKDLVMAKDLGDLAKDLDLDHY
jgi:hypothetical protein